jgi:hypothetical protein
MKPQNRFSSKENQQNVTNEASQQRELEFNEAEELLRHDRLHTPVPPSVGARLNDSLRHEPPPAKSWWKKLFRS